MSRRDAKVDMYEQFARAGKGLANPKRLELLDLLAQGERSVDSLARAAGLGINLRLLDDDHVGVATNETTTTNDVARVIEALAGLGPGKLDWEPTPVQADGFALPASLARTSDFLTHEGVRVRAVCDVNQRNIASARALVERAYGSPDV